MAIYKPRRVGLRRNQPCQHLGLRLLGSRSVRKGILLFKPLPFVVLCYGSPRKLMYLLNQEFWGLPVGVLTSPLVDSDLGFHIGDSMCTEV